MNTAAPLTFLTFREVCRRTALSEPSIRRLMKDARDPFPASFDLSPKRVGFIEAEVEAWMKRRIERGREPKEMPNPQAAAAAGVEVRKERAAKKRRKLEAQYGTG